MVDYQILNMFENDTSFFFFNKKANVKDYFKKTIFQQLLKNTMKS